MELQRGLWQHADMIELRTLADDHSDLAHFHTVWVVFGEHLADTKLLLCAYQPRTEIFPISNLFAGTFYLRRRVYGANKRSAV